MNAAVLSDVKVSLPRYLTKSRFKQALECPTKLFYAGKAGYLNNSLDNSFLAALAEGGFQVGALACLMYPDGVEVTDTGHAAQLARTHTLLQLENVTIYEAALSAQGLFVRVDILRKRGNVIELVEVKAKSFDPTKHADFRNAKGQLQPDMLPYLQDIAFQRHVAGLAFSQFQYRCFLMLADKSATTTVPGLNRSFRIQRKGNKTSVQLAPGINPSTVGAPILTALAVDDQVAEILATPLPISGATLPFADAAQHFAAAYRDDRQISPRLGKACASCEFKASTFPTPGESRSGFHECWSQTFGWTEKDFAGGTVLDIGGLRSKNDLIAYGVLKPGAVTQEDLKFDGAEPDQDGMSTKHRQWYQCSGEWPEGGDFYLDRGGLAAAMREWRYPLNFIDFETCTVAIPFGQGQRPYQTVAFQFSHHVMHEDGRVVHQSQFLDTTPGVDPCLSFLRALRDALSTNEGTVFRWAPHENTVLNHLRSNLLADPSAPSDAPELIAFIESITTREVDEMQVAGPRNMVDLCALARRYYFHPSTKGSSSLKKVLPALMRSSPMLEATYSQPIYAGPSFPSLNLTTPTAWWVERGGQVQDPYQLLPHVFSNFDEADLAEIDADGSAELHEGGSAMTAYARLQFEDIDRREREAIQNALLRYCELDTLAMVMVVQAWQAWLDDAKH
jgi:hypothetical protein